jgi:hypothetical protein
MTGSGNTPTLFRCTCEKIPFVSKTALTKEHKVTTRTIRKLLARARFQLTCAVLGKEGGKLLKGLINTAA